MGDSALMNMWLHKEVMKRLAENGGNIPANLLDGKDRSLFFLSYSTCHYYPATK